MDDLKYIDHIAMLKNVVTINLSNNEKSAMLHCLCEVYEPETPENVLSHRIIGKVSLLNKYEGNDENFLNDTIDEVLGKMLSYDGVYDEIKEKSIFKNTVHIDKNNMSKFLANLVSASNIVGLTNRRGCGNQIVIGSALYEFLKENKNESGIDFNEVQLSDSLKYVGKLSHLNILSYDKMNKDTILVYRNPDTANNEEGVRLVLFFGDGNVYKSVDEVGFHPGVNYFTFKVNF